MRRVLGLFLLVTTAAVASTAAPACGGQMPIPIPPSVSDFPPPAPAAVAYDPRIGALADVPGGLARLGSWKYEAPTIPLTPYPCAMPLSDLSTASFEVIVAPFRLMTTEVTNQAYALCVDAGTCSVPDVPLFGPNQTPLDWRDPTVARQPVLVGWGRARNFCRHYGGDLPTLGEYARATTGDDETYGQPDMLDLWQQCALGGTSAECNHLNPNRVINYFKFLDVGQDPNDIGPYGHSDLFANANEWARSFAATYLRQPPNMD